MTQRQVSCTLDALWYGLWAGIGFCAALIMSGCDARTVPAPLPPVMPAPAPIRTWRDDMIDAHNKVRQAKGLPPFARDLRLDVAGQAHSVRMDNARRLDHMIGGDPFTRLHAIYPNVPVQENIAWNTRSPAESVQAWMSSAGHRANILDRRFTLVGFGKAGWYWTVEFAGAK